MHVPKPFRPWLGVMIMMFAPLAAEGAALTLAQAERLALAHNRGLAAVGEAARAQAMLPPQVGALPDPVLSLNAMNFPVDTFSSTQENMTQLQLGVSQAIPFPGKLTLQQEAARHQAEAAQMDAREYRLLLIRNVRIHWWNLAWLDKALETVRHNLVLLRQLVRIAETKYKTGKGLQQDVLLAQLELSRLLQREIALKSERARVQASLNALLGRKADTAVRLPRDWPHDLARIDVEPAHLKQQARNTRPMLLALRARLQAADSRVALAERDYYPDFKIGAAYGLRQGSNPLTGRRRPDFASLMFSMTLPLYQGDKQDRAVDQRQAEKARAEFAWQDAVYRVDAEIDAAAVEFQRAREQVSLFETGILPQARQTTASMLAAYQVSRVDFLNLVRAQINEFNLEIRYWRELAHAYQALARLLAAAGNDGLSGGNHE